MTTSSGVCSLAALPLAKLCYETLLKDDLKAKQVMDQKMATQAFENIIEANTYLSRMSLESGGLAAAHSIHNERTVLKECHLKACCYIHFKCIEWSFDHEEG